MGFPLTRVRYVLLRLPSSVEHHALSSGPAKNNEGLYYDNAILCCLPWNM